MPSRVVLLLVASLLAGVVHVAATFLGMDPLARVAQWLYLPPLGLALVQSTWLHTRRARWWLVGLVLCWLGDGLGWLGFEVLLGLFLVGHLAYLVALWPTLRRSWAVRPAGLMHVALLVVGLVLVVPLAGSLVPAVVAYGLVLTAMALLATATGWPGLLGGLLFMVSDLSLAWLLFGGGPADLGEGWRSLVVIGTYVPAQVLLLVGVLRPGPGPRQVARVASRSTA